MKEADLDLYDAYTADEAFITSTSFCIVPVSSFNGNVIGGDFDSRACDTEADAGVQRHGRSGHRGTVPF